MAWTDCYEDDSELTREPDAADEVYLRNLATKLGELAPNVIGTDQADCDRLEHIAREIEKIKKAMREKKNPR